MRIVLLGIFFTVTAQAIEYPIEAGDTAGLIEAIEHANAHPGPDRIHLPTQAQFHIRDAHTAQLALPVISDDLEIIGNGASLILYTAAEVAHMEIAPGTRVRLVDLSLRGGTRGALVNRGELLYWGGEVEDNTSQVFASAIHNLGDMELRGVSVAYNSYSGIGDFGGAVVNQGVMEMHGGALCDNQAHGMRSVLALGAGLINLGEASLVGVEVRGNRAQAEVLPAGAIANLAPGELKLRSVTLIDNEPTALTRVDEPGHTLMADTAIVY